MAIFRNVGHEVGEYTDGFELVSHEQSVTGDVPILAKLQKALLR